MEGRGSKNLVGSWCEQLGFGAQKAQGELGELLESTMEAPWFCEEMIFITKFKAKQSMLAVLEEDHIVDFLVYILCA